jgi:hypothetical protein
VEPIGSALVLAAGLCGCLDLDALRARAGEPAPDGGQDGGQEPGPRDSGQGGENPSDSGSMAGASGGSGSGGDTSTPPDEDTGTSNASPLLALDFPPAGLTTAADITVRGRVSDPDGDAVSVQVGGVSAPIAADGSFQLRVPLELGDNALGVSALDARGASAQGSAGPVQRIAHAFADAVALRPWPGQNALLALEGSDLSLVRIDLTSLGRSVLSQGTASAASDADFVLEPGRNRALVTDPAAGAVLAVDLVSGTRTVLSSANVGSGPTMAPQRIALDPMRDRAIVADASTWTLLAIDLVTGNRTALGGTGPSFSTLTGLALSASGDRIFAVDLGTAMLVQVDPITGNRTELSGDSVGIGPAVSDPGYAVLASDETALFVSGSGPAGSGPVIFRIDLTTGTRSLLATLALGPDMPSNAVRSVPFVLEDDARALVLDPNGTLLRVSLSPALTVSTVADEVFGAGPLFMAHGVAYDETEDRLLLSSIDTSSSLYAVDPVTGDRSVLSDGTRGTGPALSGPTTIVWDEARSRVLVLDQASILSVDPVTGDRTLLSGAAAGTGPPLDDASSFTLDVVSDRIVVAMNGATTGLVSVDPTTGDRTVLSSASLGTGPIAGLRAVTRDCHRNRLLAVASNMLLAVDRATGNRSELSGGTVGSGPPLVEARHVECDPFQDRAIVADIGGLFAVDLATGARTMLLNGYRGSLAIDPPRARVVFASFSRVSALGLTALEREPISIEHRGDGPLPLGYGFELTGDATTAHGVDLGGMSGVGSQVLRVELASGDRIALPPEPRAAPRLTFGWALTHGSTATTLYVLNAFPFPFSPVRSGVFEIDTAAPTRRLIADDTIGTGPYGRPVDLAWDADRSRVVLADPTLSVLLDLDPSTGERSVLSGGPRGAGPALGQPLGVCLDRAADRLFVLAGAAGSAQVLSVDTASGDRELVSDATRGAGPSFGRVVGLACDPDGGRVMGMDLDASVFVAVDVATGDRSLLGALPFPGSADLLLSGGTLDYDATHDVLYVSVMNLYAVDTVSGDALAVSGQPR